MLSLPQQRFYFNRMKTKPLALLLALAGFALPAFAQKAQASPFVFDQEVTPLGTLQQGDKIHVALHGKNTSPAAIALENVISQNSGPADFKFPKSIGPGQKFTIEYNLNTAYLDGPFTHTIVLVGTDGTPYVTYTEGTVNAPVWFSEKIFDLGYHTPGAATEWTFYAWNPGKKPLQLALAAESAQEFSATITPAQLNIEKFDDIREGGAVPGVKIVLKAKNLGKPTGKSIRKIVAFVSPTFPQATPEVLVIGYWKN